MKKNNNLLSINWSVCVNIFAQLITFNLFKFQMMEQTVELDVKVQISGSPDFKLGASNKTNI
ncbi:MAG: hypothetical protein H6610_10795 [Ignavibacteriales bacterium]|nr:hypothetical protein [Ignavibacteriales bacterium]